MTTELGWHFVGESLRDGRPVPADGEWLEHDGDLALCRSGLHFSRRILDALYYAPGETICRVQADGEMKDGGDQLVARRRCILWRVEGEAVLRAFARWCALQVVHLWDAPAVVREYLETGNEALRDAASDAAGPAHWDAARASWAAARDAAWAVAWGASRYAAWYVARDAAWDAAGAVAWGASRYAVGDAVGDAARAVAWDAQEEQLVHMVEEARAGRMEWVWQEVRDGQED